MTVPEGPPIDPTAPPSGDGCAECTATEGWWFHLRRCATCGHVGCCDSSPSQHARQHWRDVGHGLIQSFEPNEDWFWNFDTNAYAAGTELAPPHQHPARQPVPGPAGAVPVDWAQRLHP